MAELFQLESNKSDMKYPTVTDNVPDGFLARKPCKTHIRPNNFDTTIVRPDVNSTC
ncbi:MAG: hypothetical protein AAF902_06055 [Chloroflexota bacterium]